MKINQNIAYFIAAEGTGAATIHCTNGDHYVMRLGDKKLNQIVYSDLTLAQIKEKLDPVSIVKNVCRTLMFEQWTSFNDNIVLGIDELNNSYFLGDKDNPTNKFYLPQSFVAQICKNIGSGKLASADVFKIFKALLNEASLGATFWQFKLLDNNDISLRVLKIGSTLRLCISTSKSYGLANGVPIPNHGPCHYSPDEKAFKLTAPLFVNTDRDCTMGLHSSFVNRGNHQNCNTAVPLTECYRMFGSTVKSAIVYLDVDESTECIIC